jgi:hypothetical protein
MVDRSGRLTDSTRKEQHVRRPCPFSIDKTGGAACDERSGIASGEMEYNWCATHYKQQ